MKRTITERYDEDGKLIERVTVEEDEAPTQPAYYPYVPWQRTDYWWQNPIICTAITTSDPYTVTYNSGVAA